MIPWYSIGHVTYPEQRTGCTAIIFDQQVPAVCDVRGGAPGTRETTLLDSSRTSVIDGLVLSGGSAFGLSTADGVMRFLAERGRGFPTTAGPVPLVPAAIIFDLAVGTPYAPTADDGYAAAVAAGNEPSPIGQIGAGCGATVGKLSGAPSAAGIGLANEPYGEHEITAIVVLNAIGDIVDPRDGHVVAGHPLPGGGPAGRKVAIERAAHLGDREHTTLGALLISRPVHHSALQRCCISAHDAFARCVVPAHTPFDGDVFFAVAPAVGQIDPTELLGLCCAAEVAVERAILSIFAEHDRELDQYH
jgi:L-aminopeptidase/D-esterase-like protein